MFFIQMWLSGFRGSSFYLSVFFGCLNAAYKCFFFVGLALLVDLLLEMKTCQGS